MILTNTDYSDLQKFGRITIDYTSRGVEITVDGFEFAGDNTCREHNTKALAWARDVLVAKIAANSLVPGGFIISIADMDQDQLEQERAKK
ncbi:MAG TPA: phage capsid protein [Paraburkholderia sp.]